MSVRESCWRHLASCGKSQVNIEKLLVCGQSFRWKKNGMGEWLGVMGNLVWRLCQTDDAIKYQVYGTNERKTKALEFALSRSPSRPKSPGTQSLLSKPKVDPTPGTFEEKRRSKRKMTAMPHVSLPVIKTEPLTSQERLFRKREMIDSSSNPVNIKSEFDGEKDLIKKSKFMVDSQSLKDPQNVDQSSCNDEHDQSRDGINHSEEEHHSALLKDYFQLDVDLEKLYHDWSARDPHFAKVAASFEGIRILRQDPTENLLSFVCSSNNHISRIASMVEKLCVHYGEPIASVDGVKYFSVPTFKSLSGDGVESHLRELGFGYRAKFISAIAKHIVEHLEDGWLDSLRHQNYEEAKKELLSLMGVGPKVADCVCLMSLDKSGAVPVDTHVWQITLKNYMAQLKSAKSLTDKIYNDIGDFYRNLWGPYAGWAHAVLFTADLKQNKTTQSSTEKSPSKKSKGVK